MLNSVEADVCRSHADDLQIFSRHSCPSGLFLFGKSAAMHMRARYPRGTAHGERGRKKKERKKKERKKKRAFYSIIWKDKNDAAATRPWRTSQTIYYLPSLRRSIEPYLFSTNLCQLQDRRRVR